MLGISQLNTYWPDQLRSIFLALGILLARSCFWKPVEIGFRSRLVLWKAFEQRRFLPELKGPFRGVIIHYFSLLWSVRITIALQSM
jgi:hypothetical protein